MGDFMSKKIVYSKTANRILEEAAFLKDKYKNSKISVIHAILATLLLDSDPLESVDRVELQAAVDKLGVEPDMLEKFKEITTYHLTINPHIHYEEAIALSDAQELCMINAARNNTLIIPAPVLMEKIMNSNAWVIGYLKGKLTDGTAISDVAEKIIPTEEDFDFDIEDMDLDFSEEENDVFELVQKAKELQSELFEHIYGQDEAVTSLVSGYFNALVSSSGYVRDSKPLATFLFAGAPGVGKTFLAETTANVLMRPFKRFDMSSFSDKEAAFSFAGTNKVYKNGHAGLVTDFVKKNPDCILLFDEIEKAHINVIHLFLQILDAGHLKDMYTEKDVSFSNTIIIMTTNVGRALYENNDDSLSKTAISRKVIINALSNEKNPETDAPFFPSAICSRFASGNILLFNPLGALDLIHIAESRLKEYCNTFKNSQKINLEFDKHVGPALLFSEGGKVDARSLKGRSDTFISGEVYNWLKFAYEREPEDACELENLKIKVDIDNGGEASWLFKEEETANVLLFSERENIFERIVNCDGFNFLLARNAEEAKDIISKNDIDFAVCDILQNKSEKTLNIEDTTSVGRQLFDSFIREEIPFYIFCNRIHQINTEEKQALLEQGAHGLFECYKNSDPQKILQRVRYEIACERKLTRLARANKVLTFDCSYEREDLKNGIIYLKDLRVSPAIDAEDKKDIAPLDVSNVTFDQIIGAEDAKEELKGFISFLKNPKEYARYSIPAPKGIILYGPPGTGKTMLAKALAQESGAAFIATEGNMFLKSAVGKGGENIHTIFSKARKYAPCILFIDEIDVIALNRMNSSSSVANDALNALLNEMDGFTTNPTKPVFVLAATNFDVSFGAQSALDPAVLRRFDRRIFVDLPDRNERKRFMTERLEKSRQKLSDDIIDNIAMRSMGMSLAELGLVIDFALRNMLRGQEKQLTDETFNDAFETFCFGEENSWNEETIRRVAIHESGHAFISWNAGVKPSYITVSSRSGFGGYMQPEENDSPILTIKDLKNRICTALAGRAAEIVFLGDNDGLSTGAASDLKTATSVAMQMITQFGMSTEHGLVVDGNPNEQAIKLCNEILDEQFKIAIKLISENKERILKLADTLAVKNHLIGSAVDEILKL